MRLIPHVAWELGNQSGDKNFIVVSKDTDVAVLLLYYLNSFKMMGLSQLYMYLGACERLRRLPLHILHSKLGDAFCKSLLKMHLGTGCDYLSKVGTKISELKARPEVNLLQFGEASTLDEEQIDEAEKLLVMVMNSGKSKNVPTNQASGSGSSYSKGKETKARHL